MVLEEVLRYEMLQRVPTRAVLSGSRWAKSPEIPWQGFSLLAGADSGKVKLSGHVSLSAVEMRLAHERRNPPDYQKARISTIPCPTRPHTALQVLCVDGHCVRGWILRRCLLATSSAAAVLKLYNPRLAMPARFNMDKSGTPGALPGGTLDELEGPACDWRQCHAGVLVRTDLEDYPTP
ncbi:hypothetical protein B0H13DRAFT_1887350 [Mycena leptocephala]|nr:hypothetical protein B0H13DRAFT_1887350 [Mycena leptocephala]